MREAIAADPRARAGSIEVSASDGIVTLTGNVSTLAGRRYGVLAAQKILGVLGVVDQLEVEASSRPGAEIARDVKRRVRGSRAIESRELEVAIRAGVVTLSGRVGSWAQRLEAQLLAEGIRGVREVDNQLLPDLKTHRSDDAIRGDIEAALRRDVYLTGLPISVSVEAGAVTLSGAVSSAYEKTRAGYEAGWVSNVRSLTNALRVEWWPDRSARVSLPVRRTDLELAQIVRSELSEDGRIDASAVEVAASQGHVMLSGRVPSDRQRRLAEEDARNVVGVAWVTNDLHVDFSPRPDDEVRAEIEDAFFMDSALFENKIAVSVKSGVVTLEGDVGSGYHHSHAGAIASRTRGVQAVDNRLRIMAAVIASDEALGREVQKRLERDWRTSRVHHRINVEVEDGTVTLTGDVDRWAERRSAGRIAQRTPGVRRVRNELAVDPYPYPWQEHEGQKEGDELPRWDPYYFDFPYLPWIS